MTPSVAGASSRRLTGAAVAGTAVLGLGLTMVFAGIPALETPALLDREGASDDATDPSPTDEPTPSAPRLEDVDPDAAHQSRAALDPDRPRCEPQGCERWFHALRGVTHNPFVHVAHGRVALVDDREVVVVDLASGAELTRVELDAVIGRPVSLQGRAVQTWPIDGGVAVATEDAIAVANLDGTVRWREEIDRSMSLTDTAAGHLHVNEVPAGGPFHMRSYRLDDGELVRDRADTAMLSAEPLILAEVDAARTIVTGLDGHDLTERWRTDLGDHADVFGQLLGKVLVALLGQGVPLATSPENGTANGTPEVAILAPHDGRIVAQLPGALVAATELDGLAVLVLAEPDTHRRMSDSSSVEDDEPFRFRVVAVGADRLHLDVEVATARSAVPSIELWDDDGDVLLTLDDESQRIDLAGGRLVPAPEVERDDVLRYRLDERTTLTADLGGIAHLNVSDLEVVTLERDGRRIEVSGVPGRPTAAGDGVLFVGQRSLLLVDPDAGDPVTP